VDRSYNRKLLVSVFNPQEAREAVLGGGRIIDSEDPRSALGNIKPRNIAEISRAVLDYRRDLEVQLSTNIGEDQLLYRRSQVGQAIRKSIYEMAGKAAQAAIGVAYAMQTKVHPVNIVKVGVDGMGLDLIDQVLSEIVATLRSTADFRACQVMAVLFVQDLNLWQARRREPNVIKTLVGLREYYPVPANYPNAIDLREYAVGPLLDEIGQPLFTDPGQVDLDSLIEKGALPEGSESCFISLNELFRESDYGLSDDPNCTRTDIEVMKKMVDVSVNAGANSIMLDTSILTKSAQLSLMDLASDPELIDLDQYDVSQGPNLVRKGILKLSEIRTFVDYCHYRGIEANLAGSIVSYGAQQLWRLVPLVDQQSTRGGSTAIARNPLGGAEGLNTRAGRVTNRNMVRGLVPPEQGGRLMLPTFLRDNPKARADAMVLAEKYRDLDPAWIDPYGGVSPIQF
jgi:uncharacterized protein (UPF0264 family)